MLPKEGPRRSQQKRDFFYLLLFFDFSLCLGECITHNAYNVNTDYVVEPIYCSCRETELSFPLSVSRL